MAAIEVRWERPLHQAGADEALAVSAGGLVIHERRTRLVCLEPADGSVRWDIPVGGWLRAIVIAGQRCLVLPQSTNQLICLDLGTGEDVWRVDLRRWTGHLVVGGGVVLVGGWRGYTPLHALDITTGQTLWETSQSVRTVRPAAVDGGFLIGSPGGSLARLISRSGMRKLSTWRLPRPLVDHDHRPAFTAVRTRFLVRCGDNAVVEIVPSTGIARELVLAENSLASSAPLYVGGLLWLIERGTGFTVADPRDGRILWRFNIRQPMVGQVVAENSGVGGGFILASNAGVLFRLDSDGQVIERVSIARRIRALRRLDPDCVLAITKGTLLAVNGSSGLPTTGRNRS